MLLLSLLAMGACATKPGDLKVKGEAPLVEEDAAAPLAAADEKAKADVLPVAAAEVDQADVSRRRSLSVLLKQVSNFIPFECSTRVTVTPSFSCLAASFRMRK